MVDLNEVKIYKNKKYLIWTFIGGIAFILASLYFIINAAEMRLPIIHRSLPLLTRSIGIVGFVFFGSMSFFILGKLRDQAPLLIISDTGITDQTGKASSGFIPWEDVTEIVESEVMNQRFINVMLKEPEKYIAKATAASKKLMSLNYKFYGTVVSISANHLKYDRTALKALLEARFQASKKM